MEGHRCLSEPPHPRPMRRTNPPTPRRRTVLKLLAGSLAGAGLSTGAARLAFPDEARAQVGDSAMRLEFDSTLRSRVTARQGDGFEPLTELEPSETLRLTDGTLLERFAFRDQRSEGVNDGHGRGTRHVLRGLADEGIEKEISVVLYERFPGFALLSVAYRNIAPTPASIAGWVNGAHILKPSPSDGAPAYWSFS